ncbi:hypothetical protein DERF_005132 [Dermatophagoides farinae]|uniref:Uncharacterized protein n=1 Tax=Dermatophagoides farinae TaxID=6954 RepID=A0A922I8R6_DERFA|nr:hypothetical protein DERF_005132 [Dermatophagoides farinae]
MVIGSCCRPLESSDLMAFSLVSLTVLGCLHEDGNTSKSLSSSFSKALLVVSCCLPGEGISLSTAFGVLD